MMLVYYLKRSEENVMTKEIIKYVKKASKFFIIDSKKGYLDQENEKDVDFEKYVWKTTRYNKIEKMICLYIDVLKDLVKIANFIFLVVVNLERFIRE